MRKAITPVVSVILLIMLVVAITGGAWYWMTNVQGSLQESAGSSIEQTSDLATTQFSIVSALCEAPGNITLTVINTGSAGIADANAILVTLSTIQGAVLGTNTTVSDIVASIDSGAAASFKVTGGIGTMIATNSYSIKVNIGSSSQTTTCTASNSSAT